MKIHTAFLAPTSTILYTYSMGSLVLAMFAAFFTLTPFLVSCSNLIMDAPVVSADDASVLVVVGPDFVGKLDDALLLYTSDLAAEGVSVEVVSFESGNAHDLKKLIWYYGQPEDMVFLLGELPYLEYELSTFGYHEVFPCDVFFSDRDALWEDSDNNGVYDNHTRLYPQKPVSRLAGTIQQVRGYFEKLHAYKAGQYPHSKGAFIFKDDDWHDFKRGSSFGLDRLFTEVVLYEQTEDTTRSSYVNRLTSTLSTYVYQWVHAAPQSLFFARNEEYELFTREDIPETALQGVFYNLFDCRAALFSEPNLGMSYLTDTPYGLAAIGSTKVGGNFYPMEFHRSLLLGRTWAEAFTDWFALYGVQDDAWFLGMTSLGDPSLRPVSAGVSRKIGGKALVPPDPYKREVDILLRLFEFASNNSD